METNEASKIWSIEQINTKHPWIYQINNNNNNKNNKNKFQCSTEVKRSFKTEETRFKNICQNSVIGPSDQWSMDKILLSFQRVGADAVIHQTLTTVNYISSLNQVSPETRVND